MKGELKTMAYDPQYTHKEYLFKELVIYGKNVNMVANENKVSRSCIMTYVKKFDLTNSIEEFINDLGDLQRLKKIRKEYFDQLDSGLIKEEVCYGEVEKGTYQLIEVKVPHPTMPGYFISRTFEIDYAIDEAEIQKLHDELDAEIKRRYEEELTAEAV